MCKRLATVGQTLDDSFRATTRQRIEAWLDTNHECHEKLLKLMESGMVLELVTGKQEAHLPRSCTKLNLLADHLLKKVLGKSDPRLTHSLLRDLKKSDPKWKDTLRMFALSLDPNYPLKGYMPVADFNLAWANRADILGNRLADLRLPAETAATKTIDWQANGCYSWGRPSGDETPQGNKWVLLGAEAIQNATRVVHVKSQVGLSLERLEIPKVDSRWGIQYNWNEKEATISNGGRFFVALWPDFKDDKYFDYDTRLNARFPDSPFSALWGKEAADESKKQRKAAQEAVQEAVEATKQAGYVQIVEALVPMKKRRRVT